MDSPRFKKKRPTKTRKTKMHAAETSVDRTGVPTVEAVWTSRISTERAGLAKVVSHEEGNLINDSWARQSDLSRCVDDNALGTQRKEGERMTSRRKAANEGRKERSFRSKRV
ncbi:uncharacterized protein LOC119579472 [Penaeus monodon]|uniref:uncharacterized protein LOC119579472 n=1 Tax=Penaeus monodon TaxID=6687 RepID=UPI0018A78602|nr:uncharacterized protein LOC119579472 [Penaeus monodon]